MYRFKRWAALAAAVCLLLTAGCSNNDSTTTTDPLNENAFIFVDGINGTADGAGTRAEPLADLQAGIDLAAAQNKDVCAALGSYTLDSSTDSPIMMAPTVDLLGGYQNDAGQWSRVDNYSSLTDLATAGGAYDAPRAALSCTYGALGGQPPRIEGFVITAGDGEVTTGIFVSEGSSVTIADCHLVVGNASYAYGIKNYSTDRESGTLVTVSGCTVSGGGGGQVTGICVSDGDLTVTDSQIAGLTATQSVFGINCGYGDIVITDSFVSGGTAPNSTCALYLNEAFTSVVTACTLYGGDDGTVSYAIRAMDTEEASSISDNLIDGGTGDVSVGLEMGWVEVNPAVDDNKFRASGGNDRFGILETSAAADPTSLTGNTFDASLLAGGGILYRDYTSSTTTDITFIDALNALDEDGLNPPGSVSGNVLSTD